MITQRGVFKNPLCPTCTEFEHVVFQDGQMSMRCNDMTYLVLTPNNLAQKCSKYVDQLEDKYWKHFEHATAEIQIIGEKKPVKAGFMPEERK